MQMLNRKTGEDKEKKVIKGFFYVFFGLFLISYVIYYILNSDGECITYFGRTGLITNCENKNAGYINLSFFVSLGVLFLIVGGAGFFASMKRRQKS